MSGKTKHTNSKIFLLLPDGVGLRNFVFTRFLEVGKQKGFEPVFWNNTPMDLDAYGPSVRLPKPKLHPLTDRYKSARIQIQLELFKKHSGDAVYDTYRFPNKSRNWKSNVKKWVDSFLIWRYGTEKGIDSLRKKMQQAERNTPYYNACKKQLQQQQPGMVFCTNQRPVTAIAPLTAATDLGIPTACFIFSWDNLPKATMVVETDYYFVWSEYMKQELCTYYPYIREEQVLVTGTPQFEPHYDEKLRFPQKTFAKTYKLDASKTYLCFSGDDTTTSPDDDQYLRDLATAVRQLNTEGQNLGILFRRCPVDFSNRYDVVLKEFQEEITTVDPLWKQYGDSWDTTVPTKEDIALLIQCIAHSALVVNLASSMVFDFITQEKPCVYCNYTISESKKPSWTAQKVYNFVHFRSMPENPPVFWVAESTAMKETILKALKNPEEVVPHAQTWFQTINQHPPQKASERIWEGIDTILTNE